MHQGQNFLRYQLPVEPLVLFSGAGRDEHRSRVHVRGRRSGAWSGAARPCRAYLAATPTIAQVLSSGPWYGIPSTTGTYRIAG
jgi:hypothetical protein